MKASNIKVWFEQKDVKKLHSTHDKDACTKSYGQAI
jgi:hypothetical protein